MINSTYGGKETMKNKLLVAVGFAILGLLCWIILEKVGKPIDSMQLQNAATKTQLQMEWREVVTTGVSNDEKERIISFVDTFERAIAQRDSDKVLSFFSEPETGEEQKELDFMLGSDYARDGAKPLARLFTTAGYNFSTSAHYVRNVGAQGANVRVILDELRVIPSGGEFVGYSANVARLVVELRETSHGYEIVHYYHEGKDGKYEGFIAE